jgi:hypothetical protein
MKLIEKELTYNPESFAPDLRITVAVPLELVDGQNMVNDENNDLVYALIGRKFLDCIKSQKLKTQHKNKQNVNNLDYTELRKEKQMQTHIDQQIKLLQEEHIRAKNFINENGFDCTTAPWIIVKRYRVEL